jgi:hypothetical protein
MQNAGYNPVEMYGGSLDNGASSESIPYIASEGVPFAVGLRWTGSVFRLSVYRPDGSLYEEGESDSPPLIIQIPDPEAGEWTFKVTAIDVPYNDYPYVAATGTRYYQVYLPLILLNH